MWDLIKKNFKQRQHLLYVFDSILIIYVIGVDLGSRFEQIIPSINYLPSIGTAVNFVTAMMIILTATSFAGRKAHRQIDQLQKENVPKTKIFWSKIITLILDYIDLILITNVFAILAQRIVFHGKFLNRHVIHLMAINSSANFMYVFLLVAITAIFSVLIKGIAGSVAAGIGSQYVGQAFAMVFMILLYHHRWLKWNPFNALYVQSQIIKPINHTMTKLSMPDSLFSAIIYGILFLFFAYWVFCNYPINQEKH